jgi:hypothetical protein
MTFMIPIPATVREIAAIPERAAVRRVRIRPKVTRTESCVRSVTSSSPSWRSRMTCRTPSCAAGISSCDRTSIRSRKRLDWLNILRARPTGT